MNQSVELVKLLRCKLCVLSIFIDRFASVHCDNEAVCKSASMSEHVLNKKIHGVLCHFCREAFAADIVRFSKEDTLTNLVDLFTKVLGNVKGDGVLKKLMC